MTVQNGKFELVATKNQGWNYMAAIFDVTAGGVLNMENVTLKVDGTDMTFGVHLNNWGEVTLNGNNAQFLAPYCAIRIFNSGHDMNNITLTNSKVVMSRVNYMKKLQQQVADGSLDKLPKKVLHIFTLRCIIIHI